MPVRPLPAHPSLDHLRRQARDLLKQHAARLPSIGQRLREFHPRFRHAADLEIFDAPLTLTDAQLTIARERGFASWARLKRRVEQPIASDRLDRPHHERIEDPGFRHAVDLLDAGRAEELQALLAQKPSLAHQRVPFEGGNYFRSPSLLEFIAENPVRHGKLPANAVEVARVILEAGADLASRNETLMLVATGSVVRQCHLQLPLIALLCAYGADPAPAMRMAALMGEHEAVRTLLAHGAAIDLPTAAALGNEPEFRRLLPPADPPQRHLALAMAAQFGHASLVRALLDAGENPDRYDPPGGHSHATPLHHAAGFGHADVVRLLVERGARLDLKDVLWHATPADWAAHEGRTEIEAYLRSKESPHNPDPAT